MAKILYTYGEAAELLGLRSAQALRDLVYKNRGPIQTRIGARVLFAYADLAAWAAAHRDIAPPRPSEEVPTPGQGRRRGRPSVADRQREIQQ
jgi:hypothetical protein